MRILNFTAFKFYGVYWTITELILIWPPSVIGSNDGFKTLVSFPVCATIKYFFQVADELFRLKKIDEIKYIDGRILIFDGLAGVALAIGELEKAENLYKETLKGCLQRGMEMDHNVVVGISLKVASIYAMLERHDEAEKGMLFCINCQDAKLVSKDGILPSVFFIYWGIPWQASCYIVILCIDYWTHYMSLLNLPTLGACYRD